jgi:hypothetical protein
MPTGAGGDLPVHAHGNQLRVELLESGERLPVPLFPKASQATGSC